MKSPLTPEPLRSLLARYSDNLPKIVGLSIGPAPGGKYLHWDKLRHHEPPAGLDHEEWWLGIKLARSSQAREIPLKDAAGKPFSFVIGDSVLEMLHHIDSKAKGGIELPEEVTNKETRDRYIVKSLIEEAITSSQLEGASTTHQVASDMLRSGRQARDKSEQMIFNNYKAIKHIRELKATKLTPEIVLKLHKLLTLETLDDPSAAGRLQQPDEPRAHVADNATQKTLHMPPPAEQLPARLEKMCAFANGAADGERFVHPVIRAIALHFWLAYDHPFLDGNGRTARSLFYWSMLSQGYWLFEYVSISKILKEAPSKYGKSYLYTETDDNDVTYFIIYQLEVILKAIRSMEEYLAHKVKEVNEVEKRIKTSSRFNHRQLALLNHAIRHPGAEYSIRSHQESNNVAYATARSDLQELEEYGFLVMHTLGRRKQIYRVPEDLNERLQQ
jgi:Fic family protein